MLGISSPAELPLASLPKAVPTTSVAATAVSSSGSVGTVGTQVVQSVTVTGVAGITSLGNTGSTTVKAVTVSGLTAVGLVSGVITTRVVWEPESNDQNPSWQVADTAVATSWAPVDGVNTTWNNISTG